MHFGDQSATANKLREALQPSTAKRGLAPAWVLQGVKQAVNAGRIRRPDIAITSGKTALEEQLGLRVRVGVTI